MAEGKEEGAGVEWHAWTRVQEALTTSRLGAKGGGARLVVVAYVHSWNPAAVAVAQHVAATRRLPEFKFASFFLVDADAEAERCRELGVRLTPALTFFWDGDPLVVRRATWDDDSKLVGAFSLENFHTMVRYARDSSERGGRMLHISF